MFFVSEESWAYQVEFELTAKSGWSKTSVDYIFCWYHAPRMPSENELRCYTIRLLSIVTTPEKAEDEDRYVQAAALLVNVGNNHRADITPSCTEWARRRAQLRFEVIRIDVTGLRDSPPLETRNSIRLIQASTRHEIGSALQLHFAATLKSGSSCTNIGTVASQSHRW